MAGNTAHEEHLTAAASVTIDAPLGRVWDALIDPDMTKQYMFGTTVETDWRQGSPVTWKGELNGKPYEDKGTILHVRPDRLLQYSHFSPLAGKPDTPENYHTVTIELAPEGSEANETRVDLSQDNNDSDEERAASERNWEQMLLALKKLLEK